MNHLHSPVDIKILRNNLSILKHFTDEQIEKYYQEFSGHFDSTWVTISDENINLFDAWMEANSGMYAHEKSKSKIFLIDNSAEVQERFRKDVLELLNGMNLRIKNIERQVNFLAR